jgi:hypothetical protein
MHRKTITHWIIPTILISIALSARLLPHPANFAPVGAIALFAGMYLPRRWAIAGPLLALFVSDIFIGFYSPLMMITVYGSFALMGFVGLKMRKNKTFAKILSGTFLGSVLFFLITNWAVWAFGTMYIHSLTGLMESYTMALPFFRNSLLGDVFYVGILVGAVELSRYIARTRVAHSST